MVSISTDGRLIVAADGGECDFASGKYKGRSQKVYRIGRHGFLMSTGPTGLQKLDLSGHRIAELRFDDMVVDWAAKNQDANVLDAASVVPDVLSRGTRDFLQRWSGGSVNIPSNNFSRIRDFLVGYVDGAVWLIPLYLDFDGHAFKLIPPAPNTSKRVLAPGDVFYWGQQVVADELLFGRDGEPLSQYKSRPLMQRFRTSIRGGQKFGDLSVSDALAILQTIFDGTESAAGRAYAQRHEIGTPCVHPPNSFAVMKREGQVQWRSR